MANVTSPSILLHPFIIFFFYEQLTFAFTAGFTSPQSSSRLLGLAIQGVWAWLALTTGQRHLHNLGWAPRIFAGTHTSLFLGILDRLVLNKWSIETGLTDAVEHPSSSQPKATSKKPSPSKGKTATGDYSFGDRLGYGFSVNESTRGVGTSWEVKNIPHFSTSDPSYVPSQRTFLATHVVAIVLCYYGYDYLANVSLWESDNVLLNPSYVPLIPRLGNVSIAEIVTRFQATFLYFAWSYCIIQIMYSFFAVLNVSFKPDEIPLWRPFFGPFSEMYTLRNFWGVTWHQALRRLLSTMANFLTFSVLRLSRGTLLARYTHIFFAFFVSGLMHLAADIGSSIAIQDTGCVQFFSVQALGILLEDGVQELYRRMRRGKPSTLFEKRITTVVGYVWVVAFLTWSGPAWIYPFLNIARKEDNALSFRNFRSILPF